MSYEAVVNLTVFETQFTEKRPFFLEDSAILVLPYSQTRPHASSGPLRDCYTMIPTNGHPGARAHRVVRGRSV